MVSDGINIRVETEATGDASGYGSIFTKMMRYLAAPAPHHRFVHIDDSGTWHLTHTCSMHTAVQLSSYSTVHVQLFEDDISS
jgi:hypothetical protein